MGMSQWGAKNLAERGHNYGGFPARLQGGWPGYHSLLVLDGRRKSCLTVMLRAGKARTAEGFFAFQRQTVFHPCPSSRNLQRCGVK